MSVVLIGCPHIRELVEYRKAHHLTQVEFCKMIHVPVHYYRFVETLRVHPNKRRGNRIARGVGLTFSDLFPAWQGLLIREHYFHTVTIDVTDEVLMKQAEMLYALKRGVPEQPVLLPETTATKELIADVLDCLTPRERRVIQMRYGLDGLDECTLGTIAAEFKVTRERIRQVEAKALRKLRHPTLSRKLYPELHGGEEWHRKVRSWTPFVPRSE